MEEAAFAVLDSQGFGDYVHAFLEMRKAQHEQKSMQRKKGTVKEKETAKEKELDKE